MRNGTYGPYEGTDYLVRRIGAYLHRGKPPKEIAAILGHCTKFAIYKIIHRHRELTTIYRDTVSRRDHPTERLTVAV